MKECERMEWYTVNARKCIEALHTDPKNGLTKQESTKRLAQYGKNKLTEKKKNGVLKKFFSQFADFMVLILLCAAGISFFTAISGDGDFTACDDPDHRDTERRCRHDTGMPRGKRH